MKTQPNFRAYNPEPLMLMPPDLAQWLSEDHLVYFIRDVVGQLNLSRIYADNLALSLLEYPMKGYNRKVPI